MNKDKNLPPFSEMRQMIKKIFELSNKLNGSIPIGNLDNAATCAAYLYGFSSWKEYKLYLSKENTKYPIKKTIKTIKDISFESIKVNSIKPYNLNKLNKLSKEEEEEEINTSYPLLPEWLIGKYYYQQEKIEEPRGLLPINTMFTGSILSNLSNMYLNQIDNLLNVKQMAIIFGSDSSSQLFYETIPVLEKHKVLIIGREHILIDPLKEILNNDKMDIFFNVEDNLVGNFVLLWGAIIKKIKQTNNSYQLTIKELINLTEIETLLELDKLWENDNTIENKMLNDYLNYCKINKSMLYIAKESREKHYEKSFNLISQLKEIEYLYDNNYFSENSTFNMKDAIRNGQSIYIIQENDNCYKNLLIANYIIEEEEKRKKLINLNPELYIHWSIWWEAEHWLNEHQAFELSNMDEYVIMNYYMDSQFNNLEPLINNINQIVFLQQNIKGYSQKWKDRMLSETSNSEVNFWYGENKVLKDLLINEALLWRPISNKVFIHEYKLEKIKLYDDIIKEYF